MAAQAPLDDVETEYFLLAEDSEDELPSEARGSPLTRCAWLDGFCDEPSQNQCLATCVSIPDMAVSQKDINNARQDAGRKKPSQNQRLVTCDAVPDMAVLRDELNTAIEAFLETGSTDEQVLVRSSAAASRPGSKRQAADEERWHSVCVPGGCVGPGGETGSPWWSEESTRSSGSGGRLTERICGGGKAWLEHRMQTDLMQQSAAVDTVGAAKSATGSSAGRASRAARMMRTMAHPFRRLGRPRSSARVAPED